MDTRGGEEGEGEMYGESNMEIFNAICKIADGNLLYDSGNSGALWQAEGWDGEEDGREVPEGGDMGVPMADSCWSMTENHKIL